MASKPKSRTFIVHQWIGTSCGGRYRIGARNPKEAEEMLRKKLGKHITAKMYYEVFNEPVPHGYLEKDAT